MIIDAIVEEGATKRTTHGGFMLPVNLSRGKKKVIIPNGKGKGGRYVTIPQRNSGRLFIAKKSSCVRCLR